MQTLIKASATGVLVMAGAFILWTMTVVPLHQNELVQVAERALEQPRHRQRELVEELRAHPSDPLLSGHLSLAEARLLASLEREEEAAEVYRRAVRQRVFPDALVEAGMYHLRMGDESTARELLGRAASFSPLLLTREVPSSLRQELLR